MEKLIHRAGRWFLESGIQEACGGVARYHRADVGVNAAISTEITGYAVSTFMYLLELTGDSAFRKAAQRAARYLTEVAWRPGQRTFPFEPAADGGGLAYFFDCGIIVRGLAALGDAGVFERFARPAADSMAALFRDKCVWHPVLELPSCEPVPHEPGRWSRQPGCYQLKSAMAWLETGHRRAYEAALAFALEDEESFLPGAPEPERIMDRLHAYCYFLEGLLPSADRPQAARCIARGIERVAGHLRNIAPSFARSDVYAQLLRVRLYADALGAAALDVAAARQEAQAISGFEMRSDDARTDGCFSFGRRCGALLPYANPVSTAFCLQALVMWQEYLEGRFPADWRKLI